MKGVIPYTNEQMAEYRKAWPETTVIDAFRLTCDIHPHQEALVDGKERFNFSQIWEKTLRAALAFLKLGLKKGSLVLFQVPNSIEAIYTYLGLQTIGAIPIFLLPRDGEKQLDAFCSLTEAVAWIGNVQYRKIEYIPMVKRIQERHTHLRYLIIAKGEAPAGTISFSKLMKRSRLTKDITSYLAKFSPSPDDITRLAPTGGTTGLSKLVPRSHNADICETYYSARTLKTGYGEVVLAFAPFAHDIPYLHCLLFWLTFGGKLVICPSTKPKDILEHMERERVTFCFLVPTLLGDLLNEPSLDQYNLSSLSKVCCGGAYVPAELRKATIEKLKVNFFSCYGSTEGAATMSRADDPLEVIMYTVGKPICPYDKYRIVDDEGNDVALGQEGELIIRGPSMFTGYYKSEKENRFLFTKDGFSLTGDIAKSDPRGNLIITGRKKDIIRRGAESIVPTTIEQMIITHPKVLQVAVVGMPDPRLGERICAYIQPLPGEKVNFEEVVSYLKAQGASILQLPERVEVMEKLPLTSAEKVDKLKLKADIAQKIDAEKSHHEHL
jgi:2,3-dihydroxybenzoate-AMP ligase